MSTTYPTTKQSVPNPTGTDLLDNSNAQLDHDYQHSTVNDTIEALQDKVGIDNDPNVDSFDYKLSDIASGEKAISNNGAGQTLVDITLTDPQINFGSDATGDIYYRNAGGVTTRLPIGTSGQILSTSPSSIPEWISNPAAADATYTVKGVRVLDANAVYFGADAGGTDTYAITLSPAPTAYVTGQVFTFKANTVNTGAATLNVNTLGAKSIVKGVSTVLSDGDIAAGQSMTVLYDGTNFVLQNPTATQSSFIAKFTNGVTTRNGQTASGTQTIAHGLGVAPKLVRISAKYISAGISGYTDFAISDGVYNGTSQNCVYIYEVTGGAGTAGQSTTDNASIIKIAGTLNSVAISQTAVISIDATNITLTWTAVGSGLNTNNPINILWEATA